MIEVDPAYAVIGIWAFALAVFLFAFMFGASCGYRRRLDEEDEERRRS